MREITADGEDINPESIFVIKPYDEKYQSEKISTLLASQKLKETYDSIYQNIDNAKDDLFRELSGLAGQGEDSIEEEIENVFDNKPFLDILLEKEKEISVPKNDSFPYHDIQYQTIFNGTVKKFLETKDVKESIKEYIEKYNELIEESPYLKREFNIYHFEKIQSQLEKNNFFNASHSVNLFDGKNKNEYSSSDELKTTLETAKKDILNNAELQSIFDTINKKIKNNDLRNFRDYLLNNQEILSKLADLPKLAKNIWCSYFVEHKALFLDLTKKYKDGQEKIKEILAEAEKETTEWDNVISIFNTRFSQLPFHLEIKNQKDVILREDTPTIEFVFEDKYSKDEKIYKDKEELLKILSRGEQRALYILNIIFEMEARKGEEDETLFVFDDIADSFDYKNKYAIIEYLKYMSEEKNFYMLILTYNFDFFRTVKSRGISSYNQCFIAIKNDSEVTLEKVQYLNNPFTELKKDLKDNKKLISSIPFLRNIIEYTQGKENDDYSKLTSVLHYKNNTEYLTVGCIKEVFKNNIKNINFPEDNLDKKILELVFETADKCLNANEGINLENKIVLSIAIRLKAEQFMKSNIKNKHDREGNQTWKLFKDYEKEFSNKKENIEILKRVILITPENIHINSFMYEPILDMGDIELRELYKKTKEKLKV